MDYEKKYREALERAKKLQETCDSQAVVGWCEYIFPELCEAEDEKVRRKIMEYITLYKYSLDDDEYKSWIAWLEKQGNQKLPIEKLPEEMKTIGESLGFTTQEECDEYNKMVSDLIMSDGKDKPKFKVKYAGNEYNVFDIKASMGIIWYGIEDEPNHIDYIKADSCEIISGISGYSKPTDNDMVEALRTEYEKGRADAFAQKHAEWSEEDENKIDTIISVYRPSPKLVKWLKSLKQRIEWIPSDEQIEAIRLARSFVVDDFDENPALSEILIGLEEQLKKLKGE